MYLFREQSDREQALEDLKMGTVSILIATDVASRGLDVQDITYARLSARAWVTGFFKGCVQLRST